jgi:hypothetical protein
MPASTCSRRGQRAARPGQGAQQAAGAPPLWMGRRRRAAGGKGRRGEGGGCAPACKWPREPGSLARRGGQERAPAAAARRPGARAAVPGAAPAKAGGPALRQRTSAMGSSTLSRLSSLRAGRGGAGRPSEGSLGASAQRRLGACSARWAQPHTPWGEPPSHPQAPQDPQAARHPLGALQQPPEELQAELLLAQVQQQAVALDLRARGSVSAVGRRGAGGMPAGRQGARGGGGGGGAGAGRRGLAWAVIWRMAVHRLNVGACACCRRVKHHSSSRKTSCGAVEGSS